MTKSSLLPIMFHIINKDDVAVIIYCIFSSYYSDENYESRCIFIKSVSLNMANKNIAKYTISLLTLGYVLHSSIPLTSNLDDTFHSLDKETVLSSEIYNRQCKDCDNIVEKVREDIKQKSQEKKNSSNSDRVTKVIRSIQLKSENKESKKTVSSSKIKNQISNSKQQSNGLVLTGYATAYTAKPSARMANGKKPIEGVHCAMHRKYKGRRVKVTIGNDVKYYNVDDTGPLKNGVIVDIYMNGRQKCLNFGKRKVKVEFVAR